MATADTAAINRTVARMHEIADEIGRERDSSTILDLSRELRQLAAKLRDRVRRRRMR